MATTNVSVTLVSPFEHRQKSKAVTLPTDDPGQIDATQKALVEELYSELEREIGWPVDRMRVRWVHIEPELRSG